MSTDTKRARPIDPPSLPPWLSRGDLAEGEPGEPSIVAANASGPSPQEEALPTNEPTPTNPSAPASEPAPIAQKAAEDPRALAERLAREAKARLAEQKVAEAKARAEALRLEKAAAERAPAPAPAAAPEPMSLAERARLRPKRMSAQEALQAALAAGDEPPRAAPKVTPDPAPARPQVARPSAPAPRAEAPPPVTRAEPPVARPEPANPALQIAKVAALIPTVLPGAQLKGAPIAITNLDVFNALWKAHRARALHEGAWDIVATASVLLDTVDRLGPGHVFAVRVQLGDAAYAVWVEVERKVLLGVASPADVYLTGAC